MRTFLFLLIVSLLTACGASTGEDNVYTEKNTETTGASYVTVDSIKYGTFYLDIQAEGKIAVVEKSGLQFSSGGRLVVLNVRNGTRVKLGDTLAMLDRNELKRRLQKARLQLQKAEIEREDLKIAYLGRSATDTLSQQVRDYLNLKSGYSEALLNYESAMADYEGAIITAPFDGVVANVSVSNYNYINAHTTVCNVLNTGSFQVSFPVFEYDIRSIKEGQKAVVQPYAIPEKEFAASVSAINPVIDENGKIQVTVGIEANDKQLVEGMNASVKLLTSTGVHYYIPKTSLLTRNGKNYLFLYKNEKAIWTDVTVLFENASYYAIEAVGDELSENDLVITSGNLNLRHGSEVNIMER